MSSLLDSSVFPGTQGGPLEHVIAAKAISFRECLDDSFKAYGEQVIKNAQAMAAAFVSKGYGVISGGTDNHLMLIDLRSSHPDVTGKAAENWLEQGNIITNKNMIPFDERKPVETSGLRIGTPAITTRGMKEPEMHQIAGWISDILSSNGDAGLIQKVRGAVLEVCQQFPLL